MKRYIVAICAAAMLFCGIGWQVDAQEKGRLDRARAAAEVRRLLLLERELGRPLTAQEKVPFESWEAKVDGVALLMMPQTEPRCNLPEYAFTVLDYNTSMRLGWLKMVKDERGTVTQVWWRDKTMNASKVRLPEGWIEEKSVLTALKNVVGLLTKQREENERRIDKGLAPR